LPRESSEKFGNRVTSKLLPYLINKNDVRVNRSTTGSKGKLCP